MPLYEFECTKCHHRFERLQRYSDPLPESCPECNGPVTHLMSAPAIQFKGSGWYVTDYAKRNSGPAATHSGNGNGSSSAATESKTENKPATKTEAKPESKPASTKESK